MPRPFALVLLVAVSVALAACTDGFDPVPPSLEPDAPAVETARRDSVFDVLTDMQRAAFDGAFGRLTAYGYALTRRTAAGDVNAPTAVKRTTVRIDGPDRRPALVAGDSSGSFEETAFGWFADHAALREDSTELAPFILPDDPPYRSGRGREAFLFRLLPDTLLDGRPTRVVHIEPHPVDGEGQLLRRVRLYIDRATDELAAADVTRLQDALLYGERSRSYLRIQRLPDGVWVPDSLGIDTRFSAVGSSARHYRTTASYTAFEPIDAR